jgi:hypothetical protein
MVTIATNWMIRAVDDVPPSPRSRLSDCASAGAVAKHPAAAAAAINPAITVRRFAGR